MPLTVTLPPWGPRALERFEAGWTLQKIGDEAGVSRERVRQIVHKAGLTSRLKASLARICSVDGCERHGFRGDGLCQIHHARVRNHGHTDLLPRPQRRHGTAHMYKLGCRCEPCRAADRERRRLWIASKDIAAQAPHGTWGGYCNWGCRCEPCRAAGALVNARARARRRAA